MSARGSLSKDGLGGHHHQPHQHQHPQHPQHQGGYTPYEGQDVKSFVIPPKLVPTISDWITEVDDFFHFVTTGERISAAATKPGGYTSQGKLSTSPESQEARTGMQDVLELVVIQRLAQLVPNTCHVDAIVRSRSITLIAQFAQIFDPEYVTPEVIFHLSVRSQRQPASNSLAPPQKQDDLLTNLGRVAQTTKQAALSLKKVGAKPGTNATTSGASTTGLATNQPIVKLARTARNAVDLGSVLRDRPQMMLGVGSDSTASPPGSASGSSSTGSSSATSATSTQSSNTLMSTLTDVQGAYLFDTICSAFEYLAPGLAPVAIPLVASLEELYMHPHPRVRNSAILVVATLVSELPHVFLDTGTLACAWNLFFLLDTLAGGIAAPAPLVLPDNATPEQVAALASAPPPSNASTLSAALSARTSRAVVCAALQKLSPVFTHALLVPSARASAQALESQIITRLLALRDKGRSELSSVQDCLISVFSEMSSVASNSRAAAASASLGDEASAKTAAINASFSYSARPRGPKFRAPPSVVATAAEATAMMLSPPPQISFSERLRAVTDARNRQSSLYPTFLAMLSAHNEDQLDLLGWAVAQYTCHMYRLPPPEVCELIPSFAPPHQTFNPKGSKQGDSSSGSSEADRVSNSMLEQACNTPRAYLVPLTPSILYSASSPHYAAQGITFTWHPTKPDYVVVRVPSASLRELVRFRTQPPLEVQDFIHALLAHIRASGSIVNTGSTVQGPTATVTLASTAATTEGIQASPRAAPMVETSGGGEATSPTAALAKLGPTLCLQALLPLAPSLLNTEPLIYVHLLSGLVNDSSLSLRLVCLSILRAALQQDGSIPFLDESGQEVISASATYMWSPQKGSVFPRNPSLLRALVERYYDVLSGENHDAHHQMSSGLAMKCGPSTYEFNASNAWQGGFDDPNRPVSQPSTVMDPNAMPLPCAGLGTNYSAQTLGAASQAVFESAVQVIKSHFALQMNPTSGQLEWRPCSALGRALATMTATGLPATSNLASSPSNSGTMLRTAQTPSLPAGGNRQSQDSTTEGSTLFQLLRVCVPPFADSSRFEVGIGFAFRDAYIPANKSDPLAQATSSVRALVSSTGSDPLLYAIVAEAARVGPCPGPSHLLNLFRALGADSSVFGSTSAGGEVTHASRSLWLVALLATRLTQPLPSLIQKTLPFLMAPVLPPSLRAVATSIILAISPTIGLHSTASLNSLLTAILTMLTPRRATPTLSVLSVQNDNIARVLQEDTELYGPNSTSFYTASALVAVAPVTNTALGVQIESDIDETALLSALTALMSFPFGRLGPRRLRSVLEAVCSRLNHSSSAVRLLVIQVLHNATPYLACIVPLAVRLCSVLLLALGDQDSACRLAALAGLRGLVYILTFHALLPVDLASNEVFILEASSGSRSTNQRFAKYLNRPIRNETWLPLWRTLISPEQTLASPLLLPRLHWLDKVINIFAAALGGDIASSSSLASETTGIASFAHSPPHTFTREAQQTVDNDYMNGLLVQTTSATHHSERDSFSASSHHNDLARASVSSLSSVSSISDNEHDDQEASAARRAPDVDDGDMGQVADQYRDQFGAGTYETNPHVEAGLIQELQDLFSVTLSQFASGIRLSLLNSSALRSVCITQYNYLKMLSESNGQSTLLSSVREGTGADDSSPTSEEDSMSAQLRALQQQITLRQAPAQDPIWWTLVLTKLGLHISGFSPLMMLEPLLLRGPLNDGSSSSALQGVSKDLVERHAALHAIKRGFVSGRKLNLRHADNTIKLVGSLIARHEATLNRGGGSTPGTPKPMPSPSASSNPGSTQVDSPTGYLATTTSAAVAALALDSAYYLLSLVVPLNLKSFNSTILDKHWTQTVQFFTSVTTPAGARASIARFIETCFLVRPKSVLASGEVIFKRVRELLAYTPTSHAGASWESLAMLNSETLPQITQGLTSDDSPSDSPVSSGSGTPSLAKITSARGAQQSNAGASNKAAVSLSGKAMSKKRTMTLTATENESPHEVFARLYVLVVYVSTTPSHYANPTEARRKAISWFQTLLVDMPITNSVQVSTMNPAAVNADQTLFARLDPARALSIRIAAVHALGALRHMEAAVLALGELPAILHRTEASLRRAAITAMASASSVLYHELGKDPTRSRPGNGSQTPVESYYEDASQGLTGSNAATARWLALPLLADPDPHVRQAAHELVFLGILQQHSRSGTAAATAAPHEMEFTTSYDMMVNCVVVDAEDGDLGYIPVANAQTNARGRGPQSSPTESAPSNDTGKAQYLAAATGTSVFAVLKSPPLIPDASAGILALPDRLLPFYTQFPSYMLPKIPMPSVVPLILHSPKHPITTVISHLSHYAMARQRVQPSSSTQNTSDQFDADLPSLLHRPSLAGRVVRRLTVYILSAAVCKLRARIDDLTLVAIRGMVSRYVRILPLERFQEIIYHLQLRFKNITSTSSGSSVTDALKSVIRAGAAVQAGWAALVLSEVGRLGGILLNNQQSGNAREGDTSIASEVITVVQTLLYHMSDHSITSRTQFAASTPARSFLVACVHGVQSLIAAHSFLLRPVLEHFARLPSLGYGDLLGLATSLKAAVVSLDMAQNKAAAGGSAVGGQQNLTHDELLRQQLPDHLVESLSQVVLDRLRSQNSPLSEKELSLSIVTSLSRLLPADLVAVAVDHVFALLNSVSDPGFHAACAKHLSGLFAGLPSQHALLRNFLAALAVDVRSERRASRLRALTSMALLGDRVGIRAQRSHALRLLCDPDPLVRPVVIRALLQGTFGRGLTQSIIPAVRGATREGDALESMTNERLTECLAEVITGRSMTGQQGEQSGATTSQGPSSGAASGSTSSLAVPSSGSKSDSWSSRGLSSILITDSNENPSSLSKPGETDVRATIYSAMEQNHTYPMLNTDPLNIMYLTSYRFSQILRLYGLPPTKLSANERMATALAAVASSSEGNTGTAESNNLAPLDVARFLTFVAPEDEFWARQHELRERKELVQQQRDKQRRRARNDQQEQEDEADKEALEGGEEDYIPFVPITSAGAPVTYVQGAQSGSLVMDPATRAAAIAEIRTRRLLAMGDSALAGLVQVIAGLDPNQADLLFEDLSRSLKDLTASKFRLATKLHNLMVATSLLASTTSLDSKSTFLTTLQGIGTTLVTQAEAVRSGATQALSELRIADLAMSPLRPVPFASAAEFAAYTLIQHRFSSSSGTSTRSAKESPAAALLFKHAALHASTQSTIDGLACLTTLLLAVEARIAWIAETRASSIDSSTLLSCLEWFTGLLEDPHRSIGAAAAEAISSIVRARCSDTPIPVREMAATAIAADPSLQYIQTTASNLLTAITTPKHSSRLRRRRALYVRLLSDLLPFCASSTLRSSIIEGIIACAADFDSYVASHSLQTLKRLLESDIPEIKQYTNMNGTSPSKLMALAIRLMRDPVYPCKDEIRGILPMLSLA